MPSQTGSPSPRSSSWIAAAVVTVAVFAVLYGVFPYCFGYGSVPMSLARMCYSLWTDYGDWGHGMMVFPIFFGLLYWRRNELAQVPVRGSNGGLVALGFTLLLYWVGFKADIQYVGYVSAQFFIASAVIFLLGWRFFKAMLFPWAFLGFAWPFLFLDNYIAFPLRIKMSALCYHFLNLIGQPTLQNGSALVSAPDFAAGIAAGQRFQVDIADPCSGIRSLFALTMITALYGYITLPKSWQKWVLFLSAIPLAVAGNFARIIILTFGTLWWGAEFAIGTIKDPSWYHMGAGYFVYVVALGGMIGVSWLLQRNWSPVHKAIVTAAASRSSQPSEKYDY